MERKLRLETHNAPTPSRATKVGSEFEISLRLRSLFHHGYIDVHGRAPRRGTNPLLDEYAHLLADHDYLVFLASGVGAGDHRGSESHRLGRMFARGFLAQHHGYRWFADIRDLKARPDRGWSASKRGSGNQPDWLVTRHGHAAVAEAKGTHQPVHVNSAALKPWRTQVKNIRVQKDGKDRALKTWIIATRWVTTDQPLTLPKIYAEDPPLEGQDVTEDDLAAIELWSARTHTEKNLRRLVQPMLATWMSGAVAVQQEPIVRVVWQCQVPGLEQYRFIGRVIAPEALTALPFFGAGDLWFWEELHRPRLRQRWRLFLAQLEQQAEDEAVFDGLALDVVKSCLRGEVPSEVAPDTEMADERPISLLSDGSLLAPLSVMAPLQLVEISPPPQ